MANETPNQPVERTSPNQSPPIPPLPNNPTGPNAQQVTSENDQQRITDLEGRIRRGERWMIWLTGAIAFFALCQVGVAVVQYIYGGEQTDKIIKADERLAAAMECSVDTASRALDATIKQNQLDQRAWLGVESVSGDAVIGQELRITFQARNTGRTPARNVTVNDGVKYTKKGEKPTFSYGKAKVPSRALVAPNGTFSTTRIATAGPFNDADSKALRSEDLRTYAYAFITYDDIFGVNHWLTVCAFLTKDLKTYQYCAEYNDTGETRK